MNHSLLLRALSLAALLVLGSAPLQAVAGDAVPGDLWEVTSQMSMEGVSMTLPAQKVKVCSPKVWTAPPMGEDRKMKCTNTDFEFHDPTATWKVTCTAPMAMTGDGTITWESPEAWSGSIRFTSDDGIMILNLSGHRLDDCEAKS